MTGFTNEDKYFRIVCDWRDAAMADGWTMEQTYNTEEWDSACKLKKDGYDASVLTRIKKPAGKWKYETSVYLWGPDELVIRPPFPYNWSLIVKGLNTCNNCGATNLRTFRYSFAGRACEYCLPAMKRKYEQPG